MSTHILYTEGIITALGILSQRILNNCQMNSLLINSEIRICESNDYPHYSYAIEPRYSADRGGNLTHFRFQHHLGGPRYRMMCNCKFERVCRMGVCV